MYLQNHEEFIKKKEGNNSAMLSLRDHFEYCPAPLGEAPKFSQTDYIANHHKHGTSFMTQGHAFHTFQTARNNHQILH